MEMRKKKSYIQTNQTNNGYSNKEKIQIFVTARFQDNITVTAVIVEITVVFTINNAVIHTKLKGKQISANFLLKILRLPRRQRLLWRHKC